jgi:head-tail adaptor
MKPTRSAKSKTAADQAEDRIVYDRPCTLQQYDMQNHIWTDVQHLHASINKAISTGGMNPNDSANTVRLIFKLRYFAALGEIRESMQHYRLRYGESLYEIADYDDYNERHNIIKLAANSVRIGTVSLIGETMDTDTIGQQDPTEQSFDIPCSEYEITENERADLYQMDLYADFRIRIFREEYDGEKIVEYLGKRYRVETVKYVADCADLYLTERIGDLQ